MACPTPPTRACAGQRGVAFEPGGVIRIATGLDRHRNDRQRQAVVADGAGRHAVTRVRVIEAFAGVAALVECWLETGRTHQIRVHLTHAGHALLGDPVYGGPRRLAARVVGERVAELANGFPRQALHAATLGFVHPVTGEADGVCGSAAGGHDGPDRFTSPGAGRVVPACRKPGRWGR